MSPEKQRTVENAADGMAALGGLLAALEAITGILGACTALLALIWFVVRFINLYRVNRLGKDPWLGL